MSDVPFGKDELFNAAAQIQSPDLRAAFLDAICKEDSALRAEIEELLRHDTQTMGRFDKAADDLRFAVTTAVPEHPGMQIGPYKLLQEIGHGGMGTVFMAEQEKPVRRRVALKVIRHGVDSREFIARFEAERQALALMDHPNIARVLDAGQTPAGLPYFVMELVKGIPFTRYCDEKRLSLRERIELFLPVCHAVHHAHQKGIIHRDIKPSNVLVAQYDDLPVPKVIDFGVAKATGQKLTEKTLFTALGNFVGTPEYMSPEQAGLNQLDVDTRSDVYSLGALLYEVLAGTPPFTHEALVQAGVKKMLEIICQDSPQAPSRRVETSGATLPSLSAMRKTAPGQLSRFLAGDLDVIVMKALAKDRQQRFDTPNSLATDLERFLSGNPILSRRPSRTYILRKFARRHKAAVAAAVTVSLFSLVAVVATAWGYVQRAEIRNKDNQINLARAESKAANAESKAANAKADASRYEQLVESATRLVGSTRQGAVVEARQKVREAAQLGSLSTSERLPKLRSLMAATCSSFDLESAPAVDEGFHAFGLAFTSNGKELVAAQHHGFLRNELRLFDAQNDRLLRTLPILALRRINRTGLRGLATSRNAQWIAAGGREGPIFLWGAADPTPRSWPAHKGMVTGLAFVQGDDVLLSCSSEDNLVKGWSVPSGLERFSIPLEASGCAALSVTRDSKFAAVGTADKLVVLQLGDGSVPQVVHREGGAYQIVAFSPLDDCLAANHHHSLRLFKHDAGQLLLSHELVDPKLDIAHEGDVQSIGFSRDGRHLVSVGSEHEIKIWDRMSGRLMRSLNANEPQSAVFSPDSRQLAFTDGKRVVLGRALEAPEYQVLAPHVAPIIGFAVSPDGKLLGCLARQIANSYESRFVLTTWRLPTGEFVGRRPISVEPRVFSEPDAIVFDAAKQHWVVIGKGQLMRPATGVNRDVAPPSAVPQLLRTPPDGSELWTVAGDRVAVWGKEGADPEWSHEDESSKKVATHSSIRSLDVGHQYVVAGSADSMLRLYDRRDRRDKNPRAFRGMGEPVTAVAVSEHGRAACGTLGGIVSVLTTPDLEVLAEGTSDEEVTCLEFLPDGRWLLAGSRDGRTRLYRIPDEPGTLEELMHFSAPSGRAPRQILSAGSDTLLMLHENEAALHVWNLGALRGLFRANGIDWE